MRTANAIAKEMWAPSTWQQRLSLAGQFATFCRAHGKRMNEESAVAFIAAKQVAPSTKLQYARMLRAMMNMDRTPLDMMIMGLQKIAARSEIKQARPLSKQEMDTIIRSRIDWKEQTVFRLAWITASRWSEIAALTKKNFQRTDDGSVILDWAVAPKTAKMDPHRAPRFIKTQGKGAFALIQLLATLRPEEHLTRLTTADVERILAPYGATAHSTKRGALRHAAELVDVRGMDPHVIAQLAKHVDPFDLPQNTARYLGHHTTLLTKVSSVVALM
ncbi:putative trans-sialidase [Trypanosoma theileri]|uniref:Putative trans-sialidase n=1 Tax=Trypanosoma theileri TaxID=67003 RepID=A0A1X0NUG1_9TRYP|nr:putative trans-sialidase [Trypanosoma theileri]ORC88346.1 putative trans-sialidase [Trypanosoma theileri]